MVERYDLDPKIEYFAVRNAVGMFDTSPLFKYRITGRDAERFLGGVLARDVRRCRPGQAQYTMWCDDRGFVNEEGVILRLSGDEFLLATAEANLSYLRNLIGYLAVEVEDVSNVYGILALAGPGSRALLASLAPDASQLAYFHLTQTKVDNASVVVSRTGYTGDLGYEVWVESGDALSVWDTLMEAGSARRLIPFGGLALRMLRLEAGLLLIDVDYQSSRFAWTDEQRATPIELGYGWMFRDLAKDDRAFIGRKAIEAELAGATSRWKLVGIELDWRRFEEAHRSLGLPTPKQEVPVEEAMMIYDLDREVVGYASSFMYSPMLQRHIALVRVPPLLAAPGSRVQLEIMINHRFYPVGATVRKLPFFNPARKTA